jgi:hypothetical protein
MAKRIGSGLRPARVIEAENTGKVITRLFVESGGARIKIEVTPVLRGCVYEPQTRSVAPAVEDQFGYAEMKVVSFADVYAGKLVAALDRQHPRDLFDVGDLIANEGISEEIRTAFIVYLLSHNRPMSEVLSPARLDIRQEFARGFEGMTHRPVTLDGLLETREAFIAELIGRMPRAHRSFLASFKRGEPDWKLLGIPHAEQLPAVRWRLQNLEKLDVRKRQQLIDNLLKALSIEDERLVPDATKKAGN